MSYRGQVLAAVVGASLLGVSAPEAAQSPEVTQVAAAERGTIRGIVVDADSTPLEGAMVSALGASTTALAVTDLDGRYEIASLPPGPYLLRAHLAGFMASRRDFVEIAPAVQVEHRFVLQARSGDPETTAPSVLAAGFVAPVEQADPVEFTTTTDEAEGATHDHSELAWRLRHIRRSVLKETTQLTMVDDADADAPEFSGTTGLFGRTVGSSARLASSLWTSLPVSGQLNLLTSGSFDSPADLFSNGTSPRGVAYLELGVPAGARGDWSIQGAMTSGDVSSWILAGTYASRPSEVHALDVGISFSTQRYKGGNPAAVAALRTDHRTVGAVRAVDHWAISRKLTVSYGLGIANYDYVPGPALLSPSAGVTVSPTEHTRVRARVSQSTRAPGAEEFLPPTGAGLWLPPERTFTPLMANADFRPQRARLVEVALERDFGDDYMVGVRRFHQAVNDQIVALFGITDPHGFRSDFGHYFVANGGNVDADGWGVTVSRRLAGRVSGSVDYSYTRATWQPSADTALIAAHAPTAARLGTEQFHDVTTSVRTDIPETSTRVFVLYRVNTAYAQAEQDLVMPGFDARFDVQVKQRLPFQPFESSDWEFLLSVRNLFRDELAGTGGAYDELLVVRPPKQIVGGLLVRF